MRYCIILANMVCITPRIALVYMARVGGRGLYAPEG